MRTLREEEEEREWEAQKPTDRFHLFVIDDEVAELLEAIFQICKENIICVATRSSHEGTQAAMATRTGEELHMRAT